MEEVRTLVSVCGSVLISLSSGSCFLPQIRALLSSSYSHLFTTTEVCTYSITSLTVYRCVDIMNRSTTPVRVVGQLCVSCCLVPVRKL